MRFTKIHTVESDYLICHDKIKDPSSLAKRMLDRRHGIGGEGLITVFEDDGFDARIKLYLPSGNECPFSATALISTAKYLFDEKEKKSKYTIGLGEKSYTVRLSTMGGRVLCVWLDMPRLVARPMEQLKYYHGIRGEILRACIAHPRVSVYELCGEHAVFLLDSCAALRALNIRSVCKRLEEVLFYGEKIDLHFIAVSGDNAVAVRSWRCREGELGGIGEGAVLSAYAATEYELVDSRRVMVKTVGGSFCVELLGNDSSLCAKCETVFVGEAV